MGDARAEAHFSSMQPIRNSNMTDFGGSREMCEGRAKSLFRMQMRLWHATDDPSDGGGAGAEQQGEARAME